MGKLSIHVDGGIQPTYHGGSLITGHISYDMSSSTEKIEGVMVYLAGKSICKIDEMNDKIAHNYYNHVEEIHLFRQPNALNSAPSCNEQTMEYPFSFTIPEMTTWTRAGGQNDPRYNALPHPLPPTFAMQHMGLSAAEASIRYKIKAKVNPGRILQGSEAEVVLNIVQQGISQAPLSSPTQTHHVGGASWVSSSLRLTAHNTKQKLAHVLTRDPALSTPCLQLAVQLQIPTVVTSPSSPFPIAIIVKQIMNSPADPTTPTLVLDKLILELKGTSTLRVLGTLPHAFEHTERIAGPFTVCDNATANSSGGTDVVLPVDGTPIPVPATTGAEFKLLHMLPRSSAFGRALLMPDFSTYTISYRHSISATVVIRHVESGHIFKIEAAKSPGLRIMPWEQEAGGGIGSGGGSVADDASMYDAPPPPYQQVNDTFVLDR